MSAPILLRVLARVIATSPVLSVAEHQGSNLAMSAKPSWSNPKLIFDATLADLNSDNSKLSDAGSIVLDRARPLRAQRESNRLRRERALNEAAEALAKLWKR
jgi:hypothetical protein